MQMSHHAVAGATQMNALYDEICEVIASGAGSNILIHG